MVERECSDLSLSVQSELLSISRSSLYYQKCPPSREEVAIRHRIDEIYTRCPFYGSRRIKEALGREGIVVNRKRVQRLMDEMGITAIYPGPNLSKRKLEHRVYPYLLKGITAEHPDQVWGIDITYIRLAAGWMYLVAVLDWFSRYVISWNLDSTLEMPFVIEAVENALDVGSPVILNSDQGSHFTSPQYTDMLEERGIRISMDGKGRAIDNIFTERLWRSVKYEEVYLKNYISPREAWSGLRQYFKFYNEERPHQSLDYRTPSEVYFGADRVVCSLPQEPDFNLDAA
jgi:putative transposase